MMIKTITCHDVYNVGASLQAFALMRYLSDLGHDVEIIDYKPDYLSGHFDIFKVNNPRYRGNLALSTAYVLGHMPAKISRMSSKKAFDSFRERYLHLTEDKFESNEDLKRKSPLADVFIVGSDQVWNTSFQNGKDPAFYLDFVKGDAVKASYAASFATETIEDQYIEILNKWLGMLDYISVRETSGLDILRKTGISNGVQVLDPVFLLDSKSWNEMADQRNLGENCVFLYDMDRNKMMADITKTMAFKNNLKICSVFKSPCVRKPIERMGPLEFLGYLKNASFVISNSFHATAFSLMFQKEFVVVNRKEKINTRMRDFLALLGLSDRLVSEVNDIERLAPIDYKEVSKVIKEKTELSKEYLNRVLAGRFRD